MNFTNPTKASACIEYFIILRCPLDINFSPTISTVSLSLSFHQVVAATSRSPSGRTWLFFLPPPAEKAAVIEELPILNRTNLTSAPLSSSVTARNTFAKFESTEGDNWQSLPVLCQCAENVAQTVNKEPEEEPQYHHDISCNEIVSILVCLRRELGEAPGSVWWTV